jgi:hypothetical protein
MDGEPGYINASMCPSVREACGQISNFDMSDHDRRADSDLHERIDGLTSHIGGQMITRFTAIVLD